MATFETLPPEIRVKIYRHLFADRKFSYVPYIPHRLRKRFALSRRADTKPSLDTSILFVSRKSLTVARTALLDSARFTVDLALRCCWSTNPLNTNFRIRDLLQHIEIFFWRCDTSCKRTDLGHGRWGAGYRCCGPYVGAELLRSLEKLPDLRSLTLDTTPRRWHACFIEVLNPECDNEIQRALEDAAEAGLGGMIIGYRDVMRTIILPAVQACSRQGHSFALRTRSRLLSRFQFSETGA